MPRQVQEEDVKHQNLGRATKSIGGGASIGETTKGDKRPGGFGLLFVGEGTKKVKWGETEEEMPRAKGNIYAKWHMTRQKGKVWRKHNEPRPWVDRGGKKTKGKVLENLGEDKTET